MNSALLRKTKITLSDYPYRRDIDNRLLISHLSVFEVDVLKEILHLSLKISVEQLADYLDISAENLIPILDKLSATKLFKRDYLTLVVDKEVRKYYEFQMEKFDEDFQPDMEFLQNLLNRVPLHVLPVWYIIPRTSDNIFDSIVEKFFQTPKIYLQYLEELQFEDPILQSIMQDVYQAPGFKLTASQIMAKYALSPECFEECLLQLEYHFACCLSYEKVNDRWEEVVTPFHELKEYLQLEASMKPKSIKEAARIEKTCEVEQGFIKEMAAVLTACQRKGKQIEEFKPLYLSDLTQVIAKLVQIGLAKKDNLSLSITEKGLLWLKKPIAEQMSHLAMDSLNRPTLYIESPLWNLRNLRLIEKSLRRFAVSEWIYVEDFIKGFTAPLGDRDPIGLKNRGKKWRYVFPVYQEDELNFIRFVITERLFELGVISLGSHQGKPCFCLTSVGNQFVY
ncbi:hypothetical protein [Candidatus Protochlamydia phocaeensis]|uniref:hypothetical protein n=1 Tax=Candidatus Protochlamydia phocaeensis TaxID=1414722 RepID=UPI000839923B|nr:hypothetical protein [Candidatus Protochlamydia phocaeensis]